MLSPTYKGGTGDLSARSSSGSKSPKVPRSPSANVETLLERFKISYTQVLGKGSFATVYKGLDLEGQKNVAVKVFNKDTGLSVFSDSVQAMTTLQSTHMNIEQALTDPRGKRRMDMASRRSFNPRVLQADAAKSTHGEGVNLVSLISRLDLQQQCFVKMLDYSREIASEIAPGWDPVAEKYYIVFEMGQESLSDKLARHRDEGQPLGLEELRSVHWGLVSISCALHAVGFVHLDIKPSNIVCFAGVWKLIDLDSVVKAHTAHSLDELTCTVPYLCPELAACMLDPGKRTAEVSRLVDVWSVGMCAMEAVILRPVLMVILGYSDEEDDITDQDGEVMSAEVANTNMLQWLVDEDKGEVVSSDLRTALSEINPDMSDLLQGMLERDPLERLCISECFVHPWFDPTRSRMWRELEALPDGVVVTPSGNFNEMATKPSKKGTATLPPIGGGGVVMNAAAAMTRTISSRNRRASGDSPAASSKACALM